MAIPPEKRSYLPAWLLESQAQLAQFDKEHSKAKESIEQLKVSMQSFDVLVEQSLGTPRQEVAAEAAEK